MLSGVDQDWRQARAMGESPKQRSQLHEIGPGPRDAENAKDALTIGGQYPDPLSTSETVFNKSLMSSQVFQFSIYSKSSNTLAAKDGSCRALICQSPVMPGRTSKRRKSPS